MSVPIPYPFGTLGTCLLCPKGEACDLEIHERYAALERNYQESQVTDRHEFEKEKSPAGPHGTDRHPDCWKCKEKSA